jgi:UDP-glucose 4-epimerase
VTTLITGAGAVGAQVAARLQEMGDPIVLYDVNPNRMFLETILDIADVEIVVADILDLESLVDAMRRRKADRVVHLAGLLTRQLVGDPLRGVSVNVLGTANVLEAARTAGVGRVVFTSTRGVNLLAERRSDGGSLDEDFSMRVLANRPKTMYELSKLTGEWIGLLYNDDYGVDFAAIRLAGGFGPTPGPPSGLTGNVLRSLVYGPALGQSVRITEPSLTYAGKHEFIYFKDDADAIVRACFALHLHKRVYNVRMEEPVSYQELVGIVRSVFPGCSIEVEQSRAESMSPGHLPRGDFADTTAARDELGWQPQYDLAAGVQDWAEWIRRTDGRF